MKQIRKVVILEKIYKDVFFAIIRADSQETAAQIARLLIQEGLTSLEISLNTPGAIDVIKTLAEEYKHQDVLIGAGTVLNATMANLVIQAGGKFVVSPTLDFDVIKAGNRYSIPVIPGIATPTEIIRAMEAGADVVKAFPSEALGHEFIESLHGPLPNARVIPVGGITIDSIPSWLDSGAYAIGVGSNLTHDKGKIADEEVIRQKIRVILDNIREERDKRM